MAFMGRKWRHIVSYVSICRGFLRFNAETQRRRKKEGVCLQSEGPSDFLGTDHAKPLRSARSAAPTRLIVIFFEKVCHRLSLGAYIHLVKLVARTEASSSALRFRVSRRCRLCGFSHKEQESQERSRGRRSRRGVGSAFGCKKFF